MPNGISVRVEGEELFEKLEHLPLRVAKAIIRSAVRAGAEVFRQEMKARAPRGWHVFRRTSYKGQKYKGRSREFGVLSRAIVMSISTRGDELEGTAKIGPNKKAFWGLFEEFGTKFARARPFIRAAFEAVKERALAAFISKTKEELAKNGMEVS